MCALGGDLALAPAFVANDNDGDEKDDGSSAEAIERHLVQF